MTSAKLSLEMAKEVFRIEAEAINGVAENLDHDFEGAVAAVLSCSGRVIVCGMGKSGIIGKKIAATLASTGTPSFFMHPGEAYHGDLGMVTPEDVFVAISNSGETDEVIKLVPFLKDNGNTLIAMTGRKTSTLAKAAHYHLNIGIGQEACPLQLAPTSSTTATLVMGDALAVALMKLREFRPENFARFHPGGALGRRLLSRVDDEMISVNLPVVDKDCSVIDLIHTMSKGGLGIAIVQDQDQLGVVTDGDIRRALEKYQGDVFKYSAGSFMSTDPIAVSSGTRVEDALGVMAAKGITALLVVDSASKVVGVFKK